MKTKEMLETLAKCFSDFKCHSAFLLELKEIMKKEISGKEKQLFKQLITQLSNIRNMGYIVYTADRNEQLKDTNQNYVSIHLKGSQYNVRLLTYISDTGEAYFLSAFYERAGKSRTNYSQYTSVLDERLEQLLGVIKMSNNYECSVNDLLDLFADALDPSDVLTSKLMAQISAAITRERIRLQMNQADFANHIDASQSLVSRWEHGDYNFSIKKLADIATRLDLDVNIDIGPQNIGNCYSSTSFSHAKIICFSEKAKSIHQKTYIVNTFQEGKNYAAVCK